MRKKISTQTHDIDEGGNNKIVIYALIAIVGLFLLSGVYSLVTMKPLTKTDLHVTAEQRKKMLEDINVDGKAPEVNKTIPTIEVKQQIKVNTTTSNSNATGLGTQTNLKPGQ